MTPTTRTAMVLAALLTAGLSTAAGAGTLNPHQAGTFTLEDWTASVYYTSSGGHYEVVTTIASQQAEGVPIRFVTTLAPGQTKTVAVGSVGTDGVPTVLEIKRTGDVLSAEVLPPGDKMVTQ